MECDHCQATVEAPQCLFVEVASPIIPVAMNHVLCAGCSLILGEFLCPDLQQHMGWQAEKEQYEAMRREREG